MASVPLVSPLAAVSLLATFAVSKLSDNCVDTDGEADNAHHVELAMVGRAVIGFGVDIHSGLAHVKIARAKWVRDLSLLPPMAPFCPWSPSGPWLPSRA